MAVLHLQGPGSGWKCSVVTTSCRAPRRVLQEGRLRCIPLCLPAPCCRPCRGAVLVAQQSCTSPSRAAGLTTLPSVADLHRMGLRMHLPPDTAQPAAASCTPCSLHCRTSVLSASLIWARAALKDEHLRIALLPLRHSAGATSSCNTAGQTAGCTTCSATHSIALQDLPDAVCSAPYACGQLATILNKETRVHRLGDSMQRMLPQTRAYVCRKRVGLRGQTLRGEAGKPTPSLLLPGIQRGCSHQLLPRKRQAPGRKGSWNSRGGEAGPRYRNKSIY